VTFVAAVGSDSVWAYYLTLGMVATVNPCGFAMLPAYLSYFLGLEGEDAGEAEASVTQAFRVAGAVAAGFLAVFAAAGALLELTSLPVYENVRWISIVVGVGLFLLGVAMLFGFEPSVRLPRLDRGGRERTVRSMFVFGVSYAIASVGCTMPLFLTVIVGSFSDDSVFGGLAAFAVYGLGMTLVLLALTVAVALARTSIVRFLRRSQPYIGRVSGGLVALAGAYIAWYWIDTEPGTSGTAGSNITDTVYGWSSDVTQWISDVGSIRIAVVVVILLAGTVLGVRAVRSPGGPGDAAGDAAGDAGDATSGTTAAGAPPGRDSAPTR
jgi:cytochrome c-type biogenesis protein